MSFYREFIDESTPILRGKTHDLYRYSEAGLITSGTATLEAALYGLPEIVCYKANKISYQIAKRLVKIKFISLVNLIADREVVRELIQDELNPSTLEAELKGILEHGEKGSKMLEDFEEIRELLGSHGASKKIASDMWKSLQE